ncbi:C39 family peptidase [Candidatus Uhrbacteria bacterium]|nr:C39 family peptidase [Candidatus Uhrbacteria bacterium]
MIQVTGLPYRRQHKPYTCAPAALQMVLGYFGVHISQETLEREAFTTSEQGTKEDNLVHAATSLGLHCHVSDGVSLREVKRYIRRGLPVIVSYLEPTNEERHFAVMAGFGFQSVTLYDPWNGKDFKMSQREFVRRWSSSRNRFPRWILVLSKETGEDAQPQPAAD